MQYQIDIFMNSLNQFWLQMVNFVPKLLAVVVILFVGWLVAKLVRSCANRLHLPGAWAAALAHRGYVH